MASFENRYSAANNLIQETFGQPGYMVVEPVQLCKTALEIAISLIEETDPQRIKLDSWLKYANASNVPAVVSLERSRISESMYGAFSLIADLISSERRAIEGSRRGMGLFDHYDSLKGDDYLLWLGQLGTALEKVVPAGSIVVMQPKNDSDLSKYPIFLERV